MIHDHGSVALLRNYHLFSGYEPNRLAEDWDYKHLTEDKQLTELEDLRVKPLSYHQSITASTYD